MSHPQLLPQRARSHMAPGRRAGTGAATSTTTPLSATLPTTQTGRALAIGLSYAPGGIGAVAGYLLAPEDKRGMGVTVGTAMGLAAGASAYGFTHDDAWATIDKYAVLPTTLGALLGGAVGYLIARDDKDSGSKAGGVVGVILGMGASYLMAPTAAGGTPLATFIPELVVKKPSGATGPNVSVTPASAVLK